MSEDTRRQARLRAAMLELSGIELSEETVREAVDRAWPDVPVPPVTEFYWPFTPTIEDHRSTDPGRDRMMFVCATISLVNEEAVLEERSFLSWSVVLRIWNPSMGYYPEKHTEGFAHGLSAARRCVRGGLLIVTSDHERPETWDGIVDGWIHHFDDPEPT